MVNSGTTTIVNSNKILERDVPYWQTVDLYHQRYWSGLDISIYFVKDGKAVYVDDVRDMSWAIQQLVVPIYGYNDYTARYIVPGTRQVIGQFSVNFKEASFMNLVMEELSGSDLSKKMDMQPAVGGNINILGMSMAGAAISAQAAAMLLKNKQCSVSELSDVMDAVNFAGGYTSSAQKKLVDSAMQHVNEPLFSSTEYFNIKIKYGSPEVVSQTVDKNGNKVKPQAVGTVKRVIGARITGVQQQSDDSGKPIAEVYTFQAKDVDSIDE